MGKKIEHSKQRSAYKPNSVFMGDGTGVTEEELALVEQKKKEKEEEKKLRLLKAELDENDYNASLFEISEEVKAIKILSNHVLLRLLIKPKTKGNLIIAKAKTIIDLADPDKKKFEVDDSQTAKALHRGVIVSIGETCSETFKKNAKIGDIVDLHMTVNPNQYMTIIDKEDMEFYNYYSVPETYIHYIWTKDLKNYRGKTKKTSTLPAQSDKKESPFTTTEKD